MIGICGAINLMNVKHKPINQNQNSKHCFIIKFDFNNCKLILYHTNVAKLIVQKQFANILIF